MASEKVTGRRSLDHIPHIVKDEQVFVSLAQYLQVVAVLENAEELLQKIDNSGIDIMRFVKSRLTNEKIVMQTAS